jgi:hypothetical protein
MYKWNLCPRICLRRKKSSYWFRIQITQMLFIVCSCYHLCLLGDFYGYNFLKGRIIEAFFFPFFHVCVCVFFFPFGLGRGGIIIISAHLFISFLDLIFVKLLFTIVFLMQVSE